MSTLGFFWRLISGQNLTEDSSVFAMKHVDDVIFILAASPSSPPQTAALASSRLLTTCPMDPRAATGADLHTGFAAAVRCGVSRDF